MKQIGEKKIRLSREKNTQNVTSLTDIPGVACTLVGRPEVELIDQHRIPLIRWFSVVSFTYDELIVFPHPPSPLAPASVGPSRPR